MCSSSAPDFGLKSCITISRGLEAVHGPSCLLNGQIIEHASHKAVSDILNGFLAPKRAGTSCSSQRMSSLRSHRSAPG
jgi:hypothetical protein